MLFLALWLKHHMQTKSRSPVFSNHLTIVFSVQVIIKSTQLSCLRLYKIIHIAISVASLPYYFLMEGGRVEQGYICCIKRSCLLWSNWNWTWKKEKLDSQCAKPGKIVMFWSVYYFFLVQSNLCCPLKRKNLLQRSCKFKLSYLTKLKISLKQKSLIYKL